MSPTGTPSDPRRPRRVSVRHRGAESDTATSSAADAAIREAVERRHRKRLGLAPQPAVAAPPASPRAWTAVRALVFVGVVVVLWQASAGFTPRRRAPGPAPTPCEFAGTIVLDGKPLVQAVIELHPLDAAPGATPLSLETDDTGSFARPASHGLAAGRYAVVVKSGCVMTRPGAEVGTPIAIPHRYARPETTPLQVAVTPAARLDLRVMR